MIQLLGANVKYPSIKDRDQYGTGLGVRTEEEMASRRLDVPCSDVPINSIVPFNHDSLFSLSSSVSPAHMA